MSEPFSVAKLANVFTGVYWVKVILYTLSAGFLIFIGVGVWRGYFKKQDPSTSQTAHVIINRYYQPRSTFGCASSRAWEYEHPTNREVVNGLRN